MKPVSGPGIRSLLKAFKPVNGIPAGMQQHPLSGNLPPVTESSKAFVDPKKSHIVRLEDIIDITSLTGG